MNWLCTSSGQSTGASASVFPFNIQDCFSLVQFSRSVTSDSAIPWPAALQASLSINQLLELAQTHVHPDGDAIQPPHPLSSPSPAFNLSQHQGLFQWVSSSHQVAKVLEFQLQHQSFQWVFRIVFHKPTPWNRGRDRGDREGSVELLSQKQSHALGSASLPFNYITQNWISDLFSNLGTQDHYRKAQASSALLNVFGSVHKHKEHKQRQSLKNVGQVEQERGLRLIEASCFCSK